MNEADDLERLGTIAIIGVGLIGGSIGLAARARKVSDRVVGVGRDPARLAEAKALGAIDEAEADLEKALAGAEIAVVCTPVGLIAQEVIRCAQLGPAGLLVTDVGSTKRAIVEAVDRHALARSRYLGAHPIAGSERQGVAAARNDLFVGRTCVLTPGRDVDPALLDRARNFWSALGCRLVEMTPERHDQALALTSHLPHVVAGALAGSVPIELLGLTAGSYRDGTRVAGSDPALWAEIFLANRQPLLDALGVFESQLSVFREALESASETRLTDWWNEAKRRREALNEGGISAPTARGIDP